MSLEYDITDCFLGGLNFGFMLNGRNTLRPYLDHGKFKGKENEILEFYFLVFGEGEKYGGKFL